MNEIIKGEMLDLSKASKMKSLETRNGSNFENETSNCTSKVGPNHNLNHVVNSEREPNEEYPINNSSSYGNTSKRKAPVSGILPNGAQTGSKRSKSLATLTSKNRYGGFLECSGGSDGTYDSAGDDLKEFNVPYQEDMLQRLERQKLNFSFRLKLPETICEQNNDGETSKRAILNLLREHLHNIEVLKEQTKCLISLLE